MRQVLCELAKDKADRRILCALACRLSVSLSLLGCTAGVPKISSTEDLPALTISRDEFQSKSFQQYILGLQGTAPALVTAFELSRDGGVSWEPVSPSEVSISTSCDLSCGFSVNVPAIGMRWPELQSLSSGNVLMAHIRGVSSYGMTTPKAFQLKRLASKFSVVGGFETRGWGGAGKTVGSSPNEKTLINQRLEARKPSAALPMTGRRVKGILQ